jgi:Tol biopolymer transport system component
MDADGSHVRRITNLTSSKPYGADVGRATWSPDGTRLAFGVTESPRGTPARVRALFIVSTDGSGPRRLTPWKLRAGEHPDFSPDGQQILFAAGARGAHDRGGTSTRSIRTAAGSRSSPTAAAARSCPPAHTRPTAHCSRSRNCAQASSS